MMVNGMNGGSHSRLAEWGLEGIDLQSNAHVLDIGCGGGANIEECFRGVRRVLRNGGQFLIVNEADGTGDDSAKWERLVGDMHTYTEAELHTHLTNAGFSNITISRDTQKRWLKAITTK